MENTGRVIKHILVVLLLMAIGIGGFYWLTTRKAKIKKRKTKPPLPIVEVIEGRATKHRVIVEGYGNVKPAEEMRLIPQVAGKVIYVASNLVRGGRVERDEVLLRIDPIDYELAVTLAQSKVRDAESKLMMLEAESKAAREEWVLNHGGIKGEIPEPPPLVIKEPQLLAARAALEAAQANLRKALLDLDRTEIRAPFEGIISEKNVGEGQYVLPGQVLAAIYSIESVEIAVPLEKKDLKWVKVPGLTVTFQDGARATVIADMAGKAMMWKGKVARSSGLVDDRTRMIDVIVRIEGPYSKIPPLTVGLFVNVKMEGTLLENAVLIPRSAIHQGNIVWTVDDNGTIRFKKVTIAKTEGRCAIVSSGLADGDLIVTSYHKIITEGMKVRTEKIQLESCS